MSRVTPSDSWQRARSKTAAITAFRRPVRPVAKGSRVTQLSGSYVYFLVLERSWYYAVTLALGLYVISILQQPCLPTAITHIVTLPLAFNRRVRKKINAHGKQEKHSHPR